MTTHQSSAGLHFVIAVGGMVFCIGVFLAVVILSANGLPWLGDATFGAGFVTLIASALLGARAAFFAIVLFGHRS